MRSPALQAGRQPPKIADRIAADPLLQLKLQTAERLGCPPSALDGRVPAVRLDHYDADGVLTGHTEVHREPEWTERDAALMQALAFDRGRRHSSCGHIVQDVFIEPDDLDGVGEAEVETLRCRACALTDMTNRDARMENTKPDSRGDWEPGRLEPEDGIVRNVRIVPITQQGGDTAP